MTYPTHLSAVVKVKHLIFRGIPLAFNRVFRWDLASETIVFKRNMSNRIDHYQSLMLVYKMYK